MGPEDILTLPSGLIVTPVAGLPARVRARLDWKRGDHAVSRAGSRVPTKILNAESSRLLKAFEAPKTIVEAIFDFSRDSGSRPQETLRAAFPIIKRLFDSKLLVLAGSKAAAAVTASFRPGERIGRYEIRESVQILEDAEIYRALLADGRTAALKVLRRGCSAEARSAFGRESAILKRLDGKFIPELLESGTLAGRPFLATRWIEGVDAANAVKNWKSSARGRGRLHALCSDILAAYAHLHEQGVLHGDIHPKNLLIAADGEVKIVDFGLARLERARGALGRAPRGGVGFFLEPELALARKAHREPPSCTRQSEQYSLGALLYLLLTGSHYLDFSLERVEMLEQIAAEPPIPLVRRGLKSSPKIEAVIYKALSKQPERRYRSIGELKREFDDAVISDSRHGSRTGIRHDAGANLLSEILRAARLDSETLAPSQAPTASITYGAAGIAYALYRMACHENDPALLSLADVWACRAERQTGNAAGFYSEALETTPKIAGRISPYHTASGVYAVRALVSHAMHDLGRANAAVGNFIRRSSRSCGNMDLTLGRSGTLLSCALLYEAIREPKPYTLAPLVEYGDRIMAELLAEARALPPIRECHAFPYLGIAHGWAGVLYAIVRWCAIRRCALSAEVRIRLKQLAACGETDKSGTHWQKRLYDDKGSRPEEYVSGWCNGSAGFIHLWTLADRIHHDPSFAALAEGAARHVWSNSNRMSADLCCGLGGQAYGLLALYKHSGERRWLDRARLMGKKAVEISGVLPWHGSLYKGKLGLALLTAEMRRPESSAMPFFENEGWPA